MKRNLLFLMTLASMYFGRSQNLVDRFEMDNTEMDIIYDYVLLDVGEKTVSNIITEYHITQNEDFVISPNPAKDKLNIRVLSLDEDLKLEVFDVLGKRIHKGEISRLESSVNVSNWKSGVYLVRLSNTKMSQTKRFVKQ